MIMCDFYAVMEASCAEKKRPKGFGPLRRLLLFLKGRRGRGGELLPLPSAQDPQG